MTESSTGGSPRAAIWLGAFLLVSLAIGTVGGWPGLRSQAGFAEAEEGRTPVPERGAFLGERGDADPAVRESTTGLALADVPRTAVVPPRAPRTTVEPSLRRRSDDRQRLALPVLVSRVETLVSEAVASASAASKGQANAGNVAVALRVIDLADGAVVLERQPRLALAPASNLKLVTSLAALVALGSDWNFVTRFETAGQLLGTRLEGDLVVRAGGDPLFDHDDPELAERRLREVGAALVASGLRSVSGDLVLDLGAFADASPAPGWPQPNGHWTSSYALAAGLSVNAGLISYEVEPGAIGALARSRFIPSPTGLAERLEVKTVKGRTNDVRVGLYEATGRLDLVGSIGAELPTFTGRFRHPDPVDHFGHVLVACLAESGVRVEGRIRSERDAPGGTELARLVTPWITYLEAINTHSNNAVADAVLLVLGRERYGRGDRDSGAARVREILETMGADTSAFVQVGGSGLSRDNRVTVEILSELLARIAEEPDAVRMPFVESLAVGGRTGTLSDRMSGDAAGRVHAKSGFIVGASALSGYVSTLEGRELAFSFIVSYPRLDGLNSSAWKPMHDAIALELVRWERP
jgi:serine-type D-Ala-D-Ala carboxypeptidase/endopeptidase (penicillin-binding protein 4)